MNSPLQKLLEEARQRQHLSPEEVEAQRVNFAFGNAPDGDQGTIDTVRTASTFIKQTKPNS